MLMWDVGMAGGSFIYYATIPAVSSRFLGKGRPDLVRLFDVTPGSPLPSYRAAKGLHPRLSMHLYHVLVCLSLLNWVPHAPLSFIHDLISRVLVRAVENGLRRSRV